ALDQSESSVMRAERGKQHQPYRDPDLQPSAHCLFQLPVNAHGQRHRFTSIPCAAAYFEGAEESIAVQIAVRHCPEYGNARLRLALEGKAIGMLHRPAKLQTPPGRVVPSP